MRSMPFLNDNGGCKQNLQAGDSQKGLGSISANKKSSAAALLRLSTKALGSKKASHVVVAKPRHGSKNTSHFLTTRPTQFWWGVGRSGFSKVLRLELHLLSAP